MGGQGGESLHKVTGEFVEAELVDDLLSAQGHLLALPANDPPHAVVPFGLGVA